MAFEQVNRAALNAYPGLLNAILPGGMVQGREFVCGDLSGKSGRSLSINLDRGVWRDFARGDSGSDPVSLWAAAHGCSQSEAARILAAQLGLSDERSACTPKRAAARAKQVLVEADKVPDKIVHPTLGQPAAFWVYHHQQGRVLGLVCGGTIRAVRRPLDHSLLYATPTATLLGNGRVGRSHALSMV